MKRAWIVEFSGQHYPVAPIILIEDIANGGLDNAQLQDAAERARQAVELAENQGPYKTGSVTISSGPRSIVFFEV